MPATGSALISIDARLWSPPARWWAAVPQWARYVLTVYVASRLVLLAPLIADIVVRHRSLGMEFASWDGKWYLLASRYGYPISVPRVAGQYSTLGFLPFYPMLMRLFALLPGFNVLRAGFWIATVSGAVATLAISRLAASWWGEPASRRAIVFFCLFPGTIVFSMIYSEGVELMCVAFALLALQDRRWLVAGAFGACATATSATATALIGVTLIAALVSIRELGLRNATVWRALLAPVLTALGLIAFGAYLWVHTGTPFASILAQRNAWDQKSTLMAMPDLIGRVFSDLFLNGSGPGPGPWGDDLNELNGLAGLCLLLCAMWLGWRDRDRIHYTAIVWTLGIFVLTATSPTSPPNARMLTAAFPALLVIGAKVTGRGRRLLLGVEFTALLLMSAITYAGGWLRP